MNYAKKPRNVAVVNEMLDQIRRDNLDLSEAGLAAHLGISRTALANLRANGCDAIRVMGLACKANGKLGHDVMTYIKEVKAKS